MERTGNATDASVGQQEGNHLFHDDPGDARGMEAQPLILPQVNLPNGSTHDVMVLPSMANILRGVDARSGAGLWQRLAVTFKFNKFNPPVIDGGQIYVPNYNGGVDVYRLTRECPGSDLIRIQESEER